MARELLIRLAFDGSKETARELERLGRDIRKVFTDIGKSADATSKSFKSLGSDVKKFQSRLGEFKASAGGLRDSLGQIGQGVATAGRRITVFSAAMLGLAGATVATARAGANAADAAKEQAASVGLSVEQYGRLKFALEQGGVSGEDFASAFVRLNRQIAAARAGGKSALAPFQQLGIRLTDARGRAFSAAQVFEAIGERFSRLPNDVNKTVLATELFGKSGAKLIPTLNQGRQGLRDLGDQAERLGIVFTKNQAEIGDEFSDALNRTGQAFVGLRNQIGLTFAPALTKAADAFTAGIVRNRQTIIDLIGRAWRPLGVIILDVVKLFQGRDAAVANQWLVTARDNVVAFSAAVSGAFNGIILPVVAKFRDVMQAVATEINNLFGTSISGDQLAIAVVLLKLSGLFQVFTGVVGAAVSTVGLFFNGLRTVVAIFPVIASAAAVANGALSTVFLTLIAPLKAAAIALAGLVGWPALIVAGIVAATTAIVVFWDDIISGLTRVWDFAKTVAGGIADAFRGVSRVVGNVVGALTGGPSAAPERRASGGLIAGPGSGTSDSILARLSNGEYVLRAAAVKALGTDFLDAMNMSGRIPAFAGGGSVGSGRPVNLSLDGSTFELSGGDDVVESLTRAARRRALRAPIRSPSWSTKR